MRICYIKQAENIDEYINYTSKIKMEFIKKIIMYYKKIFNIITIKPIGDSIILNLPNKNNKYMKTADKISKNLWYYGIKNIVLETTLNIDIFKNRLYEQNLNILDGRWIFGYLIINVLKYIANLKNEELENEEISILVNDLDELAVSNIYELANKIKRLNIITNNVVKLKNIENKLYEEKGIMITVSDNKRKSLARAKTILNLDFPEELLNKYTINKKAILINIAEKIKINSKSFNGININYYDIKMNDNILKKFKENNMMDTFEKNILYESILYEKNRVQTIKEKIKKDNIEISGLIGNNGIINEKEFEKISKNS